MCGGGGGGVTVCWGERVCVHARACVCVRDTVCEGERVCVCVCVQATLDKKHINMHFNKQNLIYCSLP